jgi:hypothetical protein
MSNFDSRNGNVVIGLMLVAVGIWVALARAGELPFTGQVTIWPLILGGIGLARFLQTPPGEPRQGLLFLAASAWLFLGQGGWISLSDSWPLLVIAFGLIIAFNPGRRTPEPATGTAGPAAAAAPMGPAEGRHARHRPRRHVKALSPLAVIGIWIAIFVGVQVSGGSIMRSSDQRGTSDRPRVISVMGRAEYTSRATSFRAADVANVMGRSDLDLREATIPPGGEASVEVFSAMGNVVIRVPQNWTVDTRAISALGAVRDDRFPATEADAAEAAAGPAPRLVLRGFVLMGRLTIAS